MLQGRLIGLATLAAIALPAGAPATAAAPEDHGPYTVQSTRVNLPMPLDPNGPEGALPSVNADVYVPEGGGGPWPLIELGHAWPGTLDEFPLSGWATRLASRGNVVIVSDRRGATAAEDAAPLHQPADMVDLDSDVNSEDMLRVLRWAIAESTRSGSLLEGAVDANRVAIGGHSLGAYMATFAAIRSQTEGPELAALLLLDPSDERLGQWTLDSSLTVSPNVNLPTLVLASEANQHPVMCDMDLGPDCTLVPLQQYAALTGSAHRLGIKVVGSVHEDVEDPPTTSSPPAYLQMYQRYGMAWLEYWLKRDCSAAGYLGGPGMDADLAAGRVSLLAGGAPAPNCS